jgi:hypothetical protein
MSARGRERPGEMGREEMNTVLLLGVLIHFATYVYAVYIL